MQAPGAGWDRRRVGARLRAALAGLQELQVLRERQQARVRGALDAPPPAPGAAACDSRGQERRLEGALAALKEQLSRLRQQDTGLKTHLDRLGRQISELQLGVCEGAGGPTDSDSRPSSGFYELSDAASCSRSTSCASVCSESISSSLSSLLPSAQPPKARLGGYRPRSADESTVNMAPGPAGRPHLTEGSRGAWSRFRPRPVSTGDLERVAPTELGTQRASTDVWSSSPPTHGLHGLPHVVDPTYQSDLVSRSGKEVYLYPSPLHAVALQSPLFALTREASQAESSEPPLNPLPGSTGSNLIQIKSVPEDHPAGAYIDKLLQRTWAQGSPLRGSGGERGPRGYGASVPQQACCVQRVDQGSGLRKPACSLESKKADDAPQTGTTCGESPAPPGAASWLDSGKPAGPTEASTPSESCVLGKPTRGPRLPEQEQDVPRCPQAQPAQPAPCYWDDKADVPCRKGRTRSPALPWGQPVHAHPTPLRTGSPGVQAAKAKRRTSDRALRFGGQGLRFPDRQWGAHAMPWLSPEWNPVHGPCRGGRLRGRAAVAGELPGRSCSETSLYPVPVLVPVMVARQESHRGPAQALCPLGAAPLSMVASGWARRRQRRWKSSLEISGRAHSVGLSAHPSLGPHRPLGKRAEGPQCRPSLPWPDPRACSESQPSEYSAECTSLVHSTIAETSEGEGSSDHTANRFGDGESSDSEAEGGGSQGRSGLELGQGAVRPHKLARPPPAALQSSRAGSRLKLPPVPRLCRVKASRALKKRVRRFQPASLRVMTMV